VPECKEEARLNIGSPSLGIAMCKEGLLVALTGSKESDSFKRAAIRSGDKGQIWLLDPDTLEYRKRISVPMVTSVLSSPAISTAFAPAWRKELQVIDVAKGRVARTLDASRLSRNPARGFRRHPSARILASSFQKPYVSFDGKYLFTQDWGTMHRYAIKGTALEYVEAGPSGGGAPSGGAGHWISVGSDAPFVLGGCTEALRKRAGHKRDYRGLLYRMTDLQKPVLKIPREIIYHPVIGYDLRYEGGRIYLFHNKKLELYSTTMTKVREYAVPEELLNPRGSSNAELILVHPDGGKMLTFAPYSSLLWIALGNQD